MNQPLQMRFVTLPPSSCCKLSSIFIAIAFLLPTANAPRTSAQTVSPEAPIARPLLVIPGAGATATETANDQQDEIGTIELPAEQGPAIKLVPPPAEAVETLPPNSVRFSFLGMPWRDVIGWIAEETGSALHVDAMPPGSFTYNDPQVFSHDDAIARINLFLLPQGYTIIRSGNLLSVISLTDPRGLQQLDALAPLVTPAQLETKNRHDVVKCLFPLGPLKAEDAVEELTAVKLILPPAVFNKTNQLMVTETVDKLRSVKAILDAFEPSKLDNGTIVKNFPLKYMDAEDILTVARPHLGLATGEMIGIDVSLSSDPDGKFIFVTGIEDKVKLVEQLIQTLDLPGPGDEESDAELVLRTHKVAGGNVDLAYDVLQTLLSGRENVRLSKDETAGTVVAMASEVVQREIELTVEKLAADAVTFEVIPLKNIDAFTAVGLVEQMLDLSVIDSSSSSSSRDRDSRDAQPTVEPPRLDADIENHRLFVRGTPTQIAQIKEIIAGLDQPSTASGGSDETIRIVGLFGQEAKQTLMLAARFWRLPNPIILYDDPLGHSTEPRERVVNQPTETAPRPAISESIQATATGNSPYVTTSTLTTTAAASVDSGTVLKSPSLDIKQTAINCQLTRRGLLVQCTDAEVLNQFLSHVETLAGPSGQAASEPVVFYLKYTRPEDAIRMLAELLDGGDSVASAGEGLVNGIVMSGTSSFGSLILNREGTLTLTSESATVVADSRLNRLIVQGTSADIRRIEDYLKIIEKDASITQIKTYGQSHVIELENSIASEVEAALRQAFAGRVAENKQQAPAGQGGAKPQPQQRPNPEGDKKGDAKRSAPQRTASQQARDLAPKMTLAVHEASNSLIVTAPDDLFREVEDLVKIIDGRGEQTVEILIPKNNQVIDEVLQQLMTGQAVSRRSSTRSSTSRPTSSSNTSKPRTDR